VQAVSGAFCDTINRGFPFDEVIRANHAMKGIWKDVLKFLSGAFFVTAGASWYLSWYHIAVPLPFSFFGFTRMSPDFLGLRGFIHFGLFLICFYFGFVKKSAR
jgi:hypothetical protein